MGSESSQVRVARRRAVLVCAACGTTVAGPVFVVRGEPPAVYVHRSRVELAPEFVPAGERWVYRQRAKTGRPTTVHRRAEGWLRELEARESELRQFLEQVTPEEAQETVRQLPERHGFDVASLYRSESWRVVPVPVVLTCCCGRALAVRQHDVAALLQRLHQLADHSRG